MNDPYDIPDLRPFDPEDIHIPVGEPDPDLAMPSYAFAQKPLSHAELTAAIEDAFLRARQAGDYTHEVVT